MLRHRHLTSYVFETVEFLGAESGDAALVSVPPYHIAGIAAVLTSVWSGRRLVYLPQFSPEAWVDLAAAEAVTHAMVVPTMLGRILDVLAERGEKLPALQHLSYGGGRMPVSLVERALDHLPHVGLVNAYGLTETSSTVAVLGPDDHREAIASADPHVRVRLGSVGRPSPISRSTSVVRRASRWGRVTTARSGSGAIRSRANTSVAVRRCRPTAGWPPTTGAGSMRTAISSSKGDSTT